MGITYSTPNYKNIINIDDNNHMYDLIGFTDYEIENKRTLIYYSERKDMYLYFSGDVNLIIKMNRIDENLLTTKSFQYSNFFDLKQFIDKTKQKNLIEQINTYHQNNINSEYFNNL